MRASTACLPWMGSYCGSKSLSTSTPSLLFGRSMTWPLDASTMKSLPRNLFSVLDLVGDSTTTRFLPLALSPTASSSASLTTGSGLGAAAGRPKRPRRTGAFAAGSAAGVPFGSGAAFCAADARFARGAFAVAGSADFFFDFLSSAGAPAVPSVRDFLVAMRIVPGDRAVLWFERHARRHVARARHLDRSLLVSGECLEHALQLVRVERAAGAQVQEIAPRLGGEHTALLGREHALDLPRERQRGGLDGLTPRDRAAREPAQAEHHHLHVVGRDVRLLQCLGQRLQCHLVAVQVLLELAREQAQDARGAGVVVHAHAPVPTLSSAGMWHFLYFLPLPHGHGSLRPTRGIARTGCAAGFCAGALAAWPARAGCCGCGGASAAAPPLPHASASACCATIWRGWRGASAITWRAAAGCTCTRNNRWTKSSRTSPIMVSNSVNASFLYCTSGSRWPYAWSPMPPFR